MFGIGKKKITSPKTLEEAREALVQAVCKGVVDMQLEVQLSSALEAVAFTLLGLSAGGVPNQEKGQPDLITYAQNLGVAYFASFDKADYMGQWIEELHTLIVRLVKEVKAELVKRGVFEETHPLMYWQVKAAIRQAAIFVRNYNHEKAPWVMPIIGTIYDEVEKQF